MNKRNLFERKYIVQLLSLILRGENTNQKIANELKKKTSTISEQLDYLKDNELIYMIHTEAKKYNEKEYSTDCKKIAELFLTKYLVEKELSKFKKSELVSLTFSMLISIKKEHKEVEKITLLNIFFDAYKLFLYLAKRMKEGRDPLKGETFNYTIKVNKEKEEKKFKNFLEAFYKNHEEESKKIEEDLKKASNIPKTQEKQQ